MFAASAFLDRVDTDVESRTLPGTDPAFCVIGCNLAVSEASKDMAGRCLSDVKAAEERRSAAAVPTRYRLFYGKKGL
jgi:hypothetical protein